MQRHGRLEPVAFLHAWRDMPLDGDRPHRLQNPPAHLVDAYVAAHKDELQRFVRRR